MAKEFTPTTEQVRQGYAVDIEADYRDPTTNHTPWGERAFDRWLAAHDAEVKAKALVELGQPINRQHYAAEFRRRWLEADALGLAGIRVDYALKTILDELEARS